MIANYYQVESTRTRNRYPDPITIHETELLNYVLGLTGETGELCELIKKQIFHAIRIDRTKIADELGDILWYLTMIIELFHLDLGKIMQHNLDKLQARYPDGFVTGGGKR